VQSLQERGPLVGAQCRERAFERLVAVREPAEHLSGRLRVEDDDRAAAVGGILAAHHEAVQLELRRQLAGGGQREPERRGDLAHRLLALGADVGENGQVAAPRLRLPRDELEQFRGRSAAPETAEHLAKGSPKLAELAPAHCGNTCPPLTVII